MGRFRRNKVNKKECISNIDNFIKDIHSFYLCKIYYYSYLLSKFINLVTTAIILVEFFLAISFEIAFPPIVKEDTKALNINWI